jgi:hypothetical protein
MFHLAAYSLATSAAGQNQLAGLVDPVLTRSATSNLYILNDVMQLVAAAVISPTAVSAFLQSPTLRQISNPFLRPVIGAQEPADLSEVAWFGDQPFRLPKLEELGPVVTITAAGPETSYCLLWLSKLMEPVPAGQIITVHATATTTAVASAWTMMSFTLDQSLPSGMYAVVGTEHISATGVAHRLAFPNQLYRPGSMSHQLFTDRQDTRLMTRRLGLYGQFLNTAPPLLEVLCFAADATHDLYMQLVPMSGQLGSSIT